MRISRWVLAGSLAFGGLAGAQAHDKSERHVGQKVTIEELPSAVRSTFEKEGKGGKIEELYRETQNGKTLYEGEVVKGDRGTHLDVSEDGKVLTRSTHDEAAERKRGVE